MELNNIMHVAWRFGLVALSIFAAHLAIDAHPPQDPCESVRIQLASADAPDVTLADVQKNSRCFNDGFIRVIGIYRTFYENSDLYDPLDQSASAWADFNPFYSAVKRCSTPTDLKILEREKGGTFGFIALGIIKTEGRYGHMGGWTKKFQVICVEKVELLSEEGFVFPSQPEKVQKKILAWYNNEVRKLH